MSRIGKLPVKIGKDVKVVLDGDNLNVWGKMEHYPLLSMRVY